MICRTIDSLSSLLTDYLRLHPIKPDSAEQLEITCRLFERWYQDEYKFPFLVDSMNEPLLTEFLNDLRKTRAAKTVNRKRGDLLALWRHAKRRGLLPLPDAQEVVHFPEPKRMPDAWRLEDLSRQLAACDLYQPKRRRFKKWDKRHDKALRLVLYDTAYRLTACLKLLKTNIRPEGAIVALSDSQKTNSDEAKWLGRDTIDALNEILVDSDPNDPRVFPWEGSMESFWRRWKAINRLADLPATRRDGPQKMRRTSASWLEARRPGSAQHHLRHSSPELAVKHYLDPTIAFDYRAPDVMPRISQPDSGE
jgi:hypothetical protein